MIVIKELVQGTIVSVISVYAPQCRLDDSQEDDFYDSLISTVRKLGEKEIVVIAADLNGHAGTQKTMRTSMEVNDYRVRKGKGKGFLRVLCSYEHESRECTFQDEDKSPSHL